jgi:hypothetical protein
MANAANPTVKLDWSRLLGFDQSAMLSEAAGATRLNDPRLARLGAKFGSKDGIRMPA